MIIKTEYEMDEYDYGSIHDCIVAAESGLEYISNEYIDKLIEIMPNKIKLDAMEWGFSDTVVRDNIYDWYKDNKKEIDGKIGLTLNQKDV
jgi:hypothetical protein